LRISSQLVVKDANQTFIYKNFNVLLVTTQLDSSSGDHWFPEKVIENYLLYFSSIRASLHLNLRNWLIARDADNRGIISRVVAEYDTDALALDFRIVAEANDVSVVG